MLTGLRVLDLTFYLPGPYATWLLADLGLEVIKIENPVGGDPLRGLGPGGGSPAGSAFFQAVNRGKKSLALDLKAPAGREVFLRLAATADAVVEQFRPGVAHRLGFDYEAVRAVNPKITYVSLTGYGQTGPLATAAGHDLNFMAQSGLLSLFGESGPRAETASSPPLPSAPLASAAPSPVGACPFSSPPFPLPPLQFADLNGGSLAAIALLVGMLGARLGGEGRYFDLSMTDGLFGLLSLTAADFLAGGGLPPERGNLPLTGQEPFYNVYLTADGRRLAVAALEPKFRGPLGEALAAGDPERKRPEVITASVAEMARVFAARTAADWLLRLEGLDVCLSPVLTVAEAFRGEEPFGGAAHVRARGMVAHGQVASPLRAGLSRRPPSGAGAAGGPPGGVAPSSSPVLGEHSLEILLSLGYGESDLADLARRGVIFALKAGGGK